MFLLDSYKHSHPALYPEGMSELFAYFYSRGGAFPVTPFFGLQPQLMKHLAGRVVTSEDIDEAMPLLTDHFMGAPVVQEALWRHIANDHGGKLPLHIRAVPEGTVVPWKNALYTVRSTCPSCAWLTGSMETILEQPWATTTVAAAGYHLKLKILSWLDSNGTPEEIDYKLHDFGFRGVPCVEAAAILGLAHLVNFRGTDTLVALLEARDYYDQKGAAGHSIAASEHSTAMAAGVTGELSQMDRALNAYPTGLLAYVSDGTDIFRACSQYWGTKLREKVIQRKGRLIIRPDSGDPAPTVHAVTRLLDGAFGTERNQKGSKVLPPFLRVIQGDGIDGMGETIDEIYDVLHRDGYSADNVAFGSGGGLLQKWNRDTNKFKFMVSSIVTNGIRHDVWKEPVTDPGKHSYRGELALVNLPGEGFKTVPLAEAEGQDLLRDVFLNGDVLNQQTFDDVRRRASIPIQLSLKEAA